jgi:invasion protein IalB
LGVRLESGVAIRVGEASWPIEVRYCLEHGCHGVVELDGELTEALGESTAAEITFAFDAEVPIAVTIPTVGFAEGLETLLQAPADAPQAEPGPTVDGEAAPDE